MAKHPDTDLVPYLRGELAPAERERVARHLEECPDCRQATEQLRDLLDQVARSIGQPPDVNWARYRAELREKLDARRARRAWWCSPVSAARAGRAADGAPEPPDAQMLLDLDLLKEADLARDRGLLTRMQMLERMRLLEALPVLQAPLPREAPAPSEAKDR